MSDVSDPGKAGRGDRKRAQQLVDAAYAAGRLTAADRSLRAERVSSAHTKGDLAVLTRDLDRPAATAPVATPPVAVTPPPQAPAPPQATPATPTTPSLGSAIPPEELSAMSSGASAGTIELGSVMRSALTAGSGLRRARSIVLSVVIGFVVLCGLGAGGLMTLIVHQVDHAKTPDSGSPTPSVNLQTANGWSGLVDAIKKKTGSTRVYDVVVYRDYASVNSIADEGAIRLFYRDGAFQDVSNLVSPASGKPVNLADIDPDVFAGLPDDAAKRLDFGQPDSSYLIVNALLGDPRIYVYLQRSGKLAHWMMFDFHGKPVSGSDGAALVH